MKNKPSLLVIFLTVFVDLVGFGIVLPLLPIFAKSLEASGFVIGCLMASYSAMQFLFAPIWGRLSDRIGRRPILLLSTAGAAVSYSIFAVGSAKTGLTAILLLFGARLFAGICGANITVAQAYIADGTALDAHGIDRDGLRPGLHFRAGAGRPGAEVGFAVRPRLDGRRPVRGELRLRLLQVARKPAGRRQAH
jgi:MFS family permease